MSTHRRNHLRAWNKLLQDGTIPTGDGTFRPFSDSLDPVQQNQCRRTRLRFNGTISADILDEITFDFTVDSNGQKNSRKERASIKKLYGFHEGFYIAADGTKVASVEEGGIVAVNFALGSSGGIPDDTRSGVVIQSASNYFIPFFLELAFGDITVAADKRDDDNPDSGYSLTVIGRTVQMYSVQISDFSGSMTIANPTTGGYFEFRDKNGANPVYNPNTGARLINPIPRGL